jgi:hypothetical protein
MADWTYEEYCVRIMILDNAIRFVGIAFKTLGNKVSVRGIAPRTDVIVQH